jgi:hypothetical protein
VITREELEAAGWVQDIDGAWRRPGLVHMHTATCTQESCGQVLFFCVGDHCIRALRQDPEHRPCVGHLLPTRAALVEYSLRRKGLKTAAAPGTPIDDDKTNTWSNEGDVEVSRATGGNR